MIRPLVSALFLVAALAAHAQVAPGNWSPTFAAEFNGDNSDLNGWNYDLGGGGWGNNEREVYTSSRNNSFVSGGALHVAAIATGTGSNQTYTSARLRSDVLFTQAYGLFEFRAKMPAGQGLWPALWMMPKDSAYGGWPTSGEIDVMETRGQSPSFIQGSLHSGANSGSHVTQTAVYTPPTGFTTADWHTYSLAWTKGTSTTHASLKWYVDGSLYQTQSGGWYSPNGTMDAPFDKPFYLIMNLAVGGDYVGNPNLAAGTYEMQVDNVRAYQAVPEPGTFAALGLGVLFAVRRRAVSRLRRRREG